MQFEHIGMLTENIDQEVAALELISGPMLWTADIEDRVQDVRARFGRTEAGLVYELLEPLSPTSPIAASLKKKQNVIHHICYRSDSLEETARLLRASGAFPVTEPQPGIAFGNQLIQFFYQPSGWLLEIVEGTSSPFDIA